MKKPSIIPMTPLSAVRLGVGALGAVAVGFGAYSLLAHLGPAALMGLAAWMAVALLLHDGVLAPVVSASGHGLRRAGRSLHPLSRTLIRGALVLAAVTTLIVAPLVQAQQVAGNPPVNSTVLQGNYAFALGVFWAILVVAATVAVLAVERHSRRTSQQTARS